MTMRKIGVQTTSGLLLLVLAMGACGGATSAEETIPAPISYGEFRSLSYREPGSGIYIVDGDTPVETEDGMRAAYEQYRESAAGVVGSRNSLIVNRVGSADDRWSDGQKMNLTYCVSTSFGADYGSVVQAMEAAGDEWAQTTFIRFVHLASADANCNEANTSVLFDVRPVSGRPYLARSFFPSTTRVNRNVLIDSTAFVPRPPRTLVGLLRHELGHTLGFRHEHTRPEAGACFEDNNWRSVTSYDSDSVMHYPQCNGTNTWALPLSMRDRDGVAYLYGFRSYSVAGNWPGLWSTGVDAVAVWNNGKAYFFKGSQYMRYDIITDRVDPGYPQPIAGNWPGLWSTGVDAVAVWNNGKAYFFKGSQYMRYDIATDRVDPGYPQPIAGNWPGLWSTGVDAVAVWNNGKAYFFKGNQYMRYDMAADQVDMGYPQPIVGNWAGLWPDRVNDVAVWNNGRAYFFRDAQYMRYSIAADHVD